MARAVSERCGEGQAPVVEGMLRAMTEALFGPEGRGASTGSIEFPRLSPRACEDIIQRVMARTDGGGHSTAVRQMLDRLTQALNSETGPDQGRNVLSESRPISSWSHTSQMRTARSTPMSTWRGLPAHVQTINTDLSSTVHSLLTELCKVLLEDGA